MGGLDERDEMHFGICYPSPMTLDEIVRAITELSPSDQARFDACFRALIAARKSGTYTPAADEQAGIDNGLRDVRDGNFASDAQVEAVFAKHRRP